VSDLRNHLGGSVLMAETRRWPRSGGNSSDSLAQDSELHIGGDRRSLTELA